MQYPVSDAGRDKLVFLLHILTFSLAVGCVLTVRNFFIHRERYDLLVKKEDVVAQSSLAASSSAEKVEEPEKYKVKIVNSTGTSGLAAKSSDKVKKMGYEVETSVGNGEIRSGTKILFKSSSIQATGLAKKIVAEWASGKQEIDSTLVEDIVLDLGK